MIKTVITYGTFDLFHVGHLNLLSRASRLGDRLIVGCSTDRFNETKGKRSVIPYSERSAILESLRMVDKVIPEDDWEQKRSDIAAEGVGTFVMGDDWAGKFDYLSDLCDVVYLPRTVGISTTDVKQYIQRLHEEKLSEIRNVVEHLSRIVNKT